MAPVVTMLANATMSLTSPNRRNSPDRSSRLYRYCRRSGRRGLPRGSCLPAPFWKFSAAVKKLHLAIVAAAGLWAFVPAAHSRAAGEIDLLYPPSVSPESERTPQSTPTAPETVPAAPAAEKAVYSDAYPLAAPNSWSRWCGSYEPPRRWACRPGCHIGDIWCGEGVCLNLWTAKVGAVFLNRSRPDAAVLLRDSNSLAPLANARDFDFDMAVGPDITLGRAFPLGRLELRYFGVYDWTATQTSATPNGGSLVTGANEELFMSPDANFSFKYFSRIDSTELNWTAPLADRVQWLAGFRWVELHDALASDDNDFLRWDADSHLYGAQLGAIVGLAPRGSRLSVTATGKAGVYGTNADQELSQLTLTPDPNDGDARQKQALASGDRSRTSFIGEADLTASYKLTGHVTLRGGYQLLWVNGVALASEQLGAIDPITGPVASGIDSDSDVFYHGAKASVDFAF